MYNLGIDFFSRFESYLFAPDQILFCYNARHFTRNDKAPLRTLASAFYQQRVGILATAACPLRAENGKSTATLTPNAISDIRSVLEGTPAMAHVAAIAARFGAANIGHRHLTVIFRKSYCHQADLFSLPYGTSLPTTSTKCRRFYSSKRDYETDSYHPDGMVAASFILAAAPAFATASLTDTGATFPTPVYAKLGKFLSKSTPPA
ncbi:MAG: hypothetical protein GPOALKHO_001792 [Sodalis sp.]|nr:MAG: hypothetical protein GPOALKHO_001792 [Sodalis sp.]